MNELRGGAVRKWLFNDVLYTGVTPPQSRRVAIRVLDGDRVAIRRGAATTLVDGRDILSAHSAGNITVINTRHGELRVRRPLKAVVEHLGAIGLMQIHRSTAVNVAAIRQLVGFGGHRVLLRLDDDTWLGVGRGFQREIRARLEGSALES